MIKRTGFGELEDAIVALFLKRECSLTVHEIHQAIGKDRAYTTFLTVVTRLYQKGVLTRKKEGRSYAYLLKKSKENTLLQKVKKHLLSSSPVQVFSYFLNEKSDISPDDIEEIEKMIKNYKSQQK